MLTFVVVTNVLIASLNFYLAWRLWRWRQQLKKVRQQINLACDQVDTVLPRVPPQIQGVTTHLHNLQERRQRWEAQVNQLQKILRLLGMSYRFFGRRSPRS